MKIQTKGRRHATDVHKVKYKLTNQHAYRQTDRPSRKATCTRQDKNKDTKKERKKKRDKTDDNAIHSNTHRYRSPPFFPTTVGWNFTDFVGFEGDVTAVDEWLEDGTGEREADEERERGGVTMGEEEEEGEEGDVGEEDEEDGEGEAGRVESVGIWDDDDLPSVERRVVFTADVDADPEGFWPIPGTLPVPVGGRGELPTGREGALLLRETGLVGFGPVPVFLLLLLLEDDGEIGKRCDGLPYR